jgi:hypothetical protein
MTKKLYAAAAAALIGLAMSCGQAGENVLSLVNDTNNDPVPIAGAFAQFNAAGSDKVMQQIGLLMTVTPIVKFTDASMTKEDWLAAKNLPENYDFIADPEKFGPNWEAQAPDTLGGGGALTETRS